VDKKIDAFVYNEFILKYVARTEFPGQVHVLFDTFNHYYVMDTDDWLSLMERYVGPGG
jgi:hypothetical protein